MVAAISQHESGSKDGMMLLVGAFHGLILLRKNTLLVAAAGQSAVGLELAGEASVAWGTELPGAEPLTQMHLQVMGENIRTWVRQFQHPLSDRSRRKRPSRNGVVGSTATCQGAGPYSTTGIARQQKTGPEAKTLHWRRRMRGRWGPEEPGSARGGGQRGTERDRHGGGAAGSGGKGKARGATAP